MDYKKVLVICIDRDADIAMKIGEKGPIYGRERCLDVATRLALADPTETDANTIFEAVRLYDAFKMEGKEVEVVTLQGDQDVGIVSDTELSKQLEETAARAKVDGAVIVTDGAEDEYIMPIIQSKFNVIALRRVVVKQSEKLESTYYVIQDFLKDVMEDPKLTRLVLGLPAITLILVGLLGEKGWRLIVGSVGVFLFIKGFNLEGPIQRVYDDFKNSLISGKLSFFTYALAAVLGVVAVAMGYTEVAKAEGEAGSLNLALIFISRSIGLFSFAAIVALIGKSIDALVEHRSVRKYVTLAVFVIAMKLILDSVSMFLLGEMDNLSLAISIGLGMALAIFSFLSFRSVRASTKAA